MLSDSKEDDRRFGCSDTAEVTGNLSVMKSHKLDRTYAEMAPPPFA